MSKRIFAKILVVLLLSVGVGFAQEGDMPASKEIKPSLGLGLGFLNYYGDVNSIGNHTSFINQFGYEVHVARKINRYSDLGFSFLTGTMIGNERSAERNLNFKTDIYSVSVYGTLNLDYWLNWSDVINPYVTIGFESFEYNNKADLVDANGAFYNYWDDGTIRTFAQNSPVAYQAKLMNRDYVYETDLRAADLDGFGKYPQLAIAVPIGIGVNLNVSDRLSFKMSSTFHYTFTDLIDNVSKKGEGARQGNGLNDYFTFNSISIHYDLLSSPPSNDPNDFSFPDYFVLDVEDEDMDGVVDGLDICPFTPPGVQVDEDGCPLDDDNDGVPNYLDNEGGTAQENFVNAGGKTLTDEDFYQQYLKYIDSADVPIEVLYRIAGEPVKPGSYRILLGEFSDALPEDLAKLFMAEGDVIGALNRKNQTAYLTKKYGSMDDATRRKWELINKGFPKAEIVVWEGKSYFTLDEWEAKTKKELRERFKEYYDGKEELEDMYAIKLGDTDADALTPDKAKYFEYDGVVALGGDSGKTDYVIGPFIDKVGAAQSLETIDRNKYPNAEAVYVKNGKAKSVGVKVSDVEQADVVGPDEWNKEKAKEDKTEEPEKDYLKSLDGNIVLDFGDKDSPSTKAVLNTIKSNAEVVEVVDADGKARLITKKPQSDSYVREQLEEFKQKGVQAEIKRVEGGKLVPVDTKELEKAEDIAIQNNPDKVKKEDKEGVLSGLNGGLTINFGDPKDKKTKDALKEIEKLVEVEEVTTADGETRLVAKELQTPEEAQKILEKLKKEDITPEVVEVVGDNLVTYKELPTDETKENPLKRLEGGFAISFGDPNDDKTKAAMAQIEARTETVNVQSADGEKLISKNPQSQEEAEKLIEELKAQNIEAELVKVEGGDIIPAKPKKGNNLIANIKDKLVIDLGPSNNPKAQAAKKEILAQSGVEVEEVKLPSGETKLISKTPVSKAEAKAIVNQLEEKGFDASVAKRSEEGDVIPANAAGVYSPADQSTIKQSEGNVAADFGEIESKQEEQAFQELKEAPGMKIVQDEDGNQQVIATTPEAEKVLADKLEELKDNNVEVSAAKVEGGDVVRTTGPIVPVGKEENLKEVDGSFAINFGEVNTPEKEKAIERLTEEGGFKKHVDEEGNTSLIATDPSAEAKAKSEIKRLEAKGEEVIAAKVEGGEVKPVSVPTNPVENIKKLDDKFAINFGSDISPEKQKSIEKLQDEGGFVKHVDEEGNTSLIAADPFAEAKAKSEIKQLAAKGEEVIAAKVEGGEVKPVSIPTNPAQNIKKLDDKFAINFGNDISPEKQKSIEKLQDEGGFVKHVDEEGNTSLIATDPVAEGKAKSEIQQLEDKGEDVVAAKVEGGEVKPVKVPVNPAQNIKKVDENFAINFGSDITPEKQKSIDKLQEQGGFKLAKDQAGNTALIATNPEAEEKAKAEIKSLVAKGENVEAAKIEGVISEGSSNSTTPKVPTEKVAPVNELAKEEGKFAIDFGQPDSPVKQKSIEQLKAAGNFKEVKDEAGNVSLIAMDKDAEAKAQDKIDELDFRGEEVAAAKVENGKVVKEEDDLIIDDSEDLVSDGGGIEIDDSFDEPIENDNLENNYVVKLGTVDESTPLVERGKLLKAPNTVKIRNTDGSIDVISNKASKTEEGAYAEKAFRAGAGFDDSKVAFFQDGKAEVIRKEELDGKYTVSMGSFKSGVSSKDVNKILSVPNIESIETHNPEMTTYVLGTYDSPEEAQKNIEKLIERGLEPSLVKVENGKIKVMDLGSVFDQATIDRLKIMSDKAKMVKTDEIVFRVQLGAFRQKINRNVFRGVNTLSFPTDGGITKYVTGSFSTYQQAYLHKLDMRKMGFSGSFVVAYKDGIRLKVTDLVDKDKFQQVKQTVSPIEKELKKVEAKQPVKPSDDKPKVSYKVQIGAYKEGEEAEGLSQFEEVEMEVYGQYKRYLSGDFLTYLDANNHKKEVKGLGFPGAFVVAYNNGKRVAAAGEETNVISKNDLTSTREKAAASGSTAEYQIKKVLIMVQVGLYKGDIPSDLKGKYAALPNLTKQVTSQGVIRYMTGNFKNLSEAAAYKEQLVREGFDGVFLVAYYNNERVKISEIVEILKKAL